MIAAVRRLWARCRRRQWYVPHEEGLRRLQELHAALSCFRPDECAVDVDELRRATRVVPPTPSIECPRCHRVSFHSDDIRERYCGACHAFHRDR